LDTPRCLYFNVYRFGDTAANGIVDSLGRRNLYIRPTPSSASQQQQQQRWQYSD